MKDEYKAWIGVDLDGTLAEYTGWLGPERVGAPVPAMVDRVKRWLKDGRDVRLFTARVHSLPGKDVDAVRAVIARWCLEHLGQVLPITCTKDFQMTELWDDRCVQVEPNTGQVIGRSPRRIRVREDKCSHCGHVLRLELPFEDNENVMGRFGGVCGACGKPGSWFVQYHYEDV